MSKARMLMNRYSDILGVQITLEDPEYKTNNAGKSYLYSYVLKIVDGQGLLLEERVNASSKGIQLIEDWAHKIAFDKHGWDETELCLRWNRKLKALYESKGWTWHGADV